LICGKKLSSDIGYFRVDSDFTAIEIQADGSKGAHVFRKADAFRTLGHFDDGDVAADIIGGNTIKISRKQLGDHTTKLDDKMLMQMIAKLKADPAVQKKLRKME
jgi:hypothetical protein